MELARPAQEGDLAVCTGLLERALGHTKTLRGGAVLIGPATAQELVARWTTHADDPRTLHVGLIDDVVVGLAAALTLIRPGSSRPSGLIECCYVEDEARGVGVGTALMSAMVAWCSVQECTDIDALALPGDRSTKQRLEATGFTARLLTLNCRLD
ncbi:MAG TPA: GNAT family N-acetyltransferase [Acidimicrobiales bacterium]|jgi:GNAT superfamily N-acetyltransferase|nr:GNAT family N-acetyltransferase [Acidimicrobiales bacterium]